jgi:catechol 2,3-dioxygenase-like lactoylglutathione lyase family enzyme
MSIATPPAIRCLIQDLACIYLPVTDVYTSIHWYQHNLGLTPSHHNPVQPGMPFVILTYPAQGPAVFLIQRGEPTTSNFLDHTGYQKPAVCFSVSDIAGLFAYMQANGVRFEENTLEARGGCGTNFKCYDPDGNKLDFNQAP